MKIVLIGSLGKMGEMLTALVESTNHKIVQAIDKGDEITKTADVIIDFSVAEDRKNYFNFARKHKIPYAMFSTFISEKDKLELNKLKQFVPVLICSNSSLGVFLTKTCVQKILTSKKVDFATIKEIHHQHKLDKPSGTAKSIKQMIESFSVDCECFSVRAGEIVGEHEIEFFLPHERIKITHTAEDRNLFALGAIDLCLKLVNLPAGLYDENIYENKG